MPSSPDDQVSQHGTQTDPTVRDNLTFKYLEACCEGECPQQDCSDTELPPEYGENSCPKGPVTSLELPCGDNPPCAAVTQKCVAYAQTEPRDQPPPSSGDQAVQAPPLTPTPSVPAVCDKTVCPGYLPAVTATPSATGQKPPSKEGCPTIPCPSNNPEAEYICRPTPCPGAAPSQGGMGPQRVPSGTGVAPVGGECKRNLCPAVLRALEAAYGPPPAHPCPGGPGVCDRITPVSQQRYSPGAQPSATSARMSPGGQMPPCGSPSGQLRPGGSPGAQMPCGKPICPSAQMPPGGSPGSQMPPRGSPGGQMPCASPSGQLGPAASQQMGPCAESTPMGPQPSGMSAQKLDAPGGGFGSKCPADHGLWPQYRRPQAAIRCTGMDTCPRKNPEVLGPLSPLAQMYLDMSKPKHDWGEEPFKASPASASGGRAASASAKAAEGWCCGRAPADRNRITLSFAKDIHPVIDVSLTHVDANCDEGNDGGKDHCCAKQQCCRVCK